MFYKIVSGSHILKLILPKINRLLPTSNINECAEYEDNRGQSKLDLERTQAFKMGGGHIGNKMTKVKMFQKLSPLTLKRTQKI